MIPLETIEHVAAHMRKSDVDELWANSRKTPYGALFDSVALSQETHVFEVEGKPAMIYGVAYQLDHSASPWLLATDDVHKNRKGMMRACHDAIDRWRKGTHLLYNRVAADNHTSIRFLSQLGFSFTDPIINQYGNPVLGFWMEGETCAIS